MESERQAVSQPLLADYEKVDLETGKLPEPQPFTSKASPKAPWSRLRTGLVLAVLLSFGFHVTRRFVKHSVHLNSGWDVHSHSHSHELPWLTETPGMLDALFRDKGAKGVPYGKKAEELFLYVCSCLAPYLSITQESAFLPCLQINSERSKCSRGFSPVHEQTSPCWL